MSAFTQSSASSVQSASPSLDSRLFLINLDSAVERRAHMLLQLQERNLRAHRVGIDCRSLTRRQISVAAARRFPQIEFAFDLLSGAEIGCWMSHLSAWTAFLSSGSGDACVVVEDDVLLEPDFVRTIEALEAQVSYDVVFLGTSSKNLSARRRTVVNGVWMHEPKGAIYNTWGYVLRREYLHRFFATPPLRLAVPVDHVLGGRAATRRPRVAVVQPIVVREEPRLSRASQIAPHTWRIDRWRVVEQTRRRFLASRVSDWFYAVVNSF
ncbi:MAG: glycosyltransferase family 25 protein [Betaproteobacteria bacterium]|nr:glycosyltransferase family 25 protein [Betaproteobacteria bacterium]